MINHNVILKALRDKEAAARELAHGCSVYSSNKDSDHDQRIKATRSSATSSAAGERWMAAKDQLETFEDRARAERRGAEQ